MPDKRFTITKNNNMRKKLLLSFCALMLVTLGIFAQLPTVTGKVIDDKGKPIEGASVFEKKSQKGTVTDENGVFRLPAKVGSTIVVSGVGFSRQEMVVSASTTKPYT